MLKKYVSRDNTVCASAVSITYESDDDHQINETLVSSDKIETYEDVNINVELEPVQKGQIHDLIEEFLNIFSLLPGCTDLLEHKIEETVDEPIRTRPYPILYEMYPKLKKELDDMLHLKIIEKLESPYSCPILMLKKRDGSYRFIANMRKVNSVTVFDCESMNDPNYIYSKLSGNRYLSKLDFCKGYWKIPMKSEHKHITAFSTPFAHFQFCRRAFGLKNSQATYSKLMRMLMKNLNGVDNLVDDGLGYTMVTQRKKNLPIRKRYELNPCLRINRFGIGCYRPINRYVICCILIIFNIRLTPAKVNCYSWQYFSTFYRKRQFLGVF